MSGSDFLGPILDNILWTVKIILDPQIDCAGPLDVVSDFCAPVPKQPVDSFVGDFNSLEPIKDIIEIKVIWILWIIARSVEVYGQPLLKIQHQKDYSLVVELYGVREDLNFLLIKVGKERRSLSHQHFVKLEVDDSVIAPPICVDDFHCVVDKIERF